MPLERVSQGFKDISMSFQVNPLNLDLIALKNETAIARSVRNLVLTSPGERFFNEDLGTDISTLLFENFDFTTADLIKDQVGRIINRYEPRVDLIGVEVDSNPDDYTYNVSISYKIIGIDVLPQKLSFALQSVR